MSAALLAAAGRRGACSRAEIQRLEDELAKTKAELAKAKLAQAGRKDPLGTLGGTLPEDPLFPDLQGPVSPPRLDAAVDRAADVGKAG